MQLLHSFETYIPFDDSREIAKAIDVLNGPEFEPSGQLDIIS